MSGKTVSRKKVANVIKGKTQHTDDLAEKHVTTSAIAGFGNLVTADKLQLPQQESVVLASQADTDRAYLDELAFGEQPVEITIADDTSEYPIDPVPMSCNGKQIFVSRGVPTIVPRKFVECLTNPVLRVKTRKVKNNLDEDTTVLDRTRSLQYPFSLTEINGSTPKTKAWLHGLLTRE
jgi:hypothetical protein